MICSYIKWKTSSGGMLGSEVKCMTCNPEIKVGPTLDPLGFVGFLSQDTSEPQLCTAEIPETHGYVSCCHDLTEMMVKML